ncbi:hypothetical protein [Bacillus weihaiensis]|nr:hypothetical protein [Bacillus weihaiensis]
MIVRILVIKVLVKQAKNDIVYRLVCGFLADPIKTMLNQQQVASEEWM